jgi:hypothetical protein
MELADCNLSERLQTRGAGRHLPSRRKMDLVELLQVGGWVGGEAGMLISKQPATGSVQRSPALPTENLLCTPSHADRH